MSSPQEQSDLADLKRLTIELKLSCFDTQVHYLRNGVVNTGHVSVEAACLWTVKYYQSRVEKLAKDYIKKYPD